MRRVRITFEVRSQTIRPATASTRHTGGPGRWLRNHARARGPQGLHRARRAILGLRTPRRRRAVLATCRKQRPGTRLRTQSAHHEQGPTGTKTRFRSRHGIAPGRRQFVPGQIGPSHSSGRVRQGNSSPSLCQSIRVRSACRSARMWSRALRTSPTAIPVTPSQSGGPKNAVRLRNQPMTTPATMRLPSLPRRARAPCRKSSAASFVPPPFQSLHELAAQADWLS